MRLILTAILAGLLLGCADPAPRPDAPTRVVDRNADPLAQDRLCRVRAIDGQPYPYCPPTDPQPRRVPAEDPVSLPPLPISGG